MNEGRFNQLLRIELVRRSFFVMKHADSWTMGIPDLSASRGKSTAWLESKVSKVSAFRPMFDFRKVIHPKDPRAFVQLATMCSLEQHASTALYCLFLVLPSGKWRLYLMSPRAVRQSVRMGAEATLPKATELTEVLEWMK